MTNGLARNARQHGLLLALVFAFASFGRMSFRERIEHEREALLQEKAILGIKHRLQQWAKLRYESAPRESIRQWTEANISEKQLSLSPVQLAKLKNLLPVFVDYLAAPSAQSYQDAFPMVYGREKYSLLISPAPSGVTPLARIVNAQNPMIWFTQTNLPRLVAIAPSSLQVIRPAIRTLDGGVVSLSNGICTIAAHATSSDVAVAALNSHRDDHALVILRFVGMVDSSQEHGPFVASFSWDESQAAWLPRKMCYEGQLHFRTLF